MGAWIETEQPAEGEQPDAVAPYVGAWIETCYCVSRGLSSQVVPLVGAWNETSNAFMLYNFCRVAPPSWGVD